MIENLKEKTGKTLEEWMPVVKASGKEKHREIINFLKDEHSLTYGFANLIAMKFRAADAGSHDADDLVEKHYQKGKEHLRPIYDQLIAAVTQFGSDVEIAPKMAYVSLRRKKQFAIFQPSTKTRFDVGLNIKGKAPEGRLEAAGSWNGMCSHRIRLADVNEVNDELIGWIREAYQGAG